MYVYIYSIFFANLLHSYRVARWAAFCSQKEMGPTVLDTPTSLYQGTSRWCIGQPVNYEIEYGRVLNDE